MRLYLICDSQSEDTAVGMRLAGIESTLVSSADEVNGLLEKLVSEGDIGIILINRKLCEECGASISEFRKNHSLPIIVEIPERDSVGEDDSISAYVREAIGINI